MKAQDQRRLIQIHINKLLPYGYRVVSQTDTTAQLVKPKRFNVIGCIAGCILLGFIAGIYGIVGVLAVYLVFYLGASDANVYLQTKDDGTVSRSTSGCLPGLDLPAAPKRDERTLSNWVCSDCGYRLLYEDDGCPRCRSTGRKWIGRYYYQGLHSNIWSR
jgi:hypothetical protein